MRKIYKRPRHNQDLLKKTRINNQITNPEIQLIDEDGEYLGKINTIEALNMAKEKGFELIEINPNAVPPIAKLIDYGKYKYEQEKRQKKQKLSQKKVEIKGLRLSFRIGQHDLDVRKNQAVKHLNQGDKLKIEMTLKGREHHHVDIARETLTKFIESINAEFAVKMDEPIKRAGSKLLTIISENKKEVKKES